MSYIDLRKGVRLLLVEDRARGRRAIPVDDVSLVVLRRLHGVIFFHVPVGRVKTVVPPQKVKDLWDVTPIGREKDS